MKIAFCLHFFLPQSIGGTEIYTFQLARHLSDLGYEIVVIIPNYDSTVTKEYMHQGIRVIQFAEPSKISRSLIMGKTKPVGLKEFENILILEKPDVIHFHELSYGRGISIYHVEKANEFKIPIVTTYHLASYTCYKGSLIYKSINKCDGVININKCTQCVLESKNIVGLQAKILVYTSLVLYNLKVNTTLLNKSLGTALGFPFIIKKIKNDLIRIARISSKTIVLTNWYKSVLERNGLPPEKLTFIKQGLTGNVFVNKSTSKIGYPLKIVFIGRISKIKNLHVLINAICSFSQDKISLHIYGPVNEVEYVNSCKEKSFLNKNIHWCGSIDPENVIKTLTHYHLLCLPSAYEMSPLCIQEAFAAGLPVLASAVNGNMEQITNGLNGWLFDLNDENSLTSILHNLINDPTLIENARLHLPECNTFCNIAIEHNQIYLDIIKNK